MTTEHTETNKQNAGNEDAAVKPNPETLNTTDPQEKMEGPLSSLMHKTGEGMEKEETAEEDK